MEKFATEQDAANWMYEVLEDEEYFDNYRFAILSDADAVAVYEQKELEGCCGRFDAEIEVAGEKAWIGCNYGH